MIKIKFYFMLDLELMAFATKGDFWPIIEEHMQLYEGKTCKKVKRTNLKLNISIIV